MHRMLATRGGNNQVDVYIIEDLLFQKSFLKEESALIP